MNQPNLFENEDCEHEFISYICDATQYNELIKNIPHRSQSQFRQVFCQLGSLCVRCGYFLSMNKESFLLYKSFYEPIKGLSKELKGELLDAIFLYQIDGIEPDMNNPIYMAFAFFKNQFRLDNEKYEKVVQKNKANGMLGGRPKTQKNPKNPTEPKKADNDNEKENDNEKDNVPTLEEFILYSKTLSPYKTELDFALTAKYNQWVESKWKDGNGNKIKNWKTKLQNTITYLKPTYTNTMPDNSKSAAYKKFEPNKP